VGYYQFVHLFLLVAFLSLARVKSLESLRYRAPGQWGEVLGLDRIVRSLAAKLPPKLARFGAMNLPGAIEPEAVEKFLQKKAALQQEIAQRQTQLQKHKAERAKVAHHLPLGEVPESERFDRLSSDSKDLVDTIKLVAYRAGTTMAQVVREALPQWRQEEERRLLQSLYGSEADLIPNEAAGTLTLRLYYPANALLARAVQKLCEELTATETVFPTTKLRLVYQLADGGVRAAPVHNIQPPGCDPNPVRDD
jgi:hypothetical protein